MCECMSAIGAPYQPRTLNPLDMRCIGNKGTPSTDPSNTAYDGLGTDDRARGLLRVEFATDQAGAAHKLYVWNGTAWVEHSGTTELDDLTDVTSSVTSGVRTTTVTRGGALSDHHFHVNGQINTLHTITSQAGDIVATAGYVEAVGMDARTSFKAGTPYTDANTPGQHGGFYTKKVDSGDSYEAGIYFGHWPGATNNITYVYARAGNATSGVLTALYSVWVYPSDDLLKFNEVALPSGLDAVKLLQPRRYMKVQALEDEQVPENACPEIGFVAQEVEQVPNLDVLVRDYPDAKDITKTVKAVNYNGITAVNTQALKELLAKVEALEARVAALEA